MEMKRAVYIDPPHYRKVLNTHKLRGDVGTGEWGRLELGGLFSPVQAFLEGGDLIIEISISECRDIR